MEIFRRALTRVCVIARIGILKRLFGRCVRYLTVIVRLSVARVASMAGTPRVASTLKHLELGGVHLVLILELKLGVVHTRVYVERWLGPASRLHYLLRIARVLRWLRGTQTVCVLVGE